LRTVSSGVGIYSCNRLRDSHREFDVSTATTASTLRARVDVGPAVEYSATHQDRFREREVSRVGRRVTTFFSRTTLPARRARYTHQHLLCTPFTSSSTLSPRLHSKTAARHTVLLSIFRFLDNPRHTSFGISGSGLLRVDPP